MEKTKPTVTTLSAAANALQSAGISAPINAQIDALSNALTGTHRKRELKCEKEGFPSEVKNVLEILKIQIVKAISSLAETNESEELYRKFVDDLEIVEAFADRVIKFYQPKEQPLCEPDERLKTSVEQSFAKAKAEAVTSLALEAIYQKINYLQRCYRNNPDMTCEEFLEKLEELSSKVKKWEQEFLPENQILRESLAVAQRITRLKSKLHQAIEMSSLHQHPGVMGQRGLEILRLASGMVEYAKSQFELEQGVLMAMEANQNLRRSGKQFQERGRSFNLLIQQSIAIFVDKQLRKLEAELKQPLYYTPQNFQKIQCAAERLVRQMERLTTYFEFVDKWAGPHQEDLLERIAIIYEMMVARARKAKDLALDQACSRGITQDHAESLARIAAKFRQAESMSRDVINPKTIFHEEFDIEKEILELMEKVPDPSFHKGPSLTFTLLGRSHYRALSYLKENIEQEHKQKLQTILNRIDFYVLRTKVELDIFLETVVRRDYMLTLKEQELFRFMSLIGMDPAVTSPIRYAKYSDPSEYPFKGSQLAKVINSWRIADNFLKGRYGNITEHPQFVETITGLFFDLKAYSQKVFLELLKRLQFSIASPPSLDTIESKLKTRIQAFPKKMQSEILSAETRIAAEGNAKELQELWQMLQYLKLPKELKRVGQINFMKKQELIALSSEFAGEQALLADDPELSSIKLPLDHTFLEKKSNQSIAKKALKRLLLHRMPGLESIKPFSDQLLKECMTHKQTAERILLPLAEKKREMIQKAVFNSIALAMKETTRIAFEMAAPSISNMNGDKQFHYDHKTPELLPLYMEGLQEKRKAGQDVAERVLVWVEGSAQLQRKIESFATKSLFDAPMHRTQSLIKGVLELLQIDSIHLNLDECAQFLSRDENKNVYMLVGFASLIVEGPLPSTGNVDEIGSIVMRVQMRLTQDEASNAYISFLTKPYQICISEYRGAHVWGLA